MPKARARLEPTTSMTVAPTTARTIWVSMTGAEGVAPLRVGEARHQLRRPLHVGGTDHREQLLMPTDVVELDVLAVDGRDEAVPLEALEAIAARIVRAGLAE